MTRRASVRINVVANFAGKIWSGLMSIAFVPLYIRLLGVEAYGLVGIYVVLLALFSVLDLGLSTTLNREFARISVQSGDEREARHLVRTFEVIYWGIGALLGVFLLLLAPIIARNWIHATNLSTGDTTQAIGMMGLVLACQWPASLYLGGLLGLQRHVLLNVIMAFTATIQSVGAALVLWLVAPTIQAYFLWQIVANAIQTMLLAICLWRALPSATERAVFKAALWRRNFGFTAGLIGISLLTIVLTQVDKLMLSHVLSLEQFSYYAFAAGVTSGLSYLVTPIFSTLFPRFAQAVADKSEDIAHVYHRGSQLMALTVAPAAFTLILYAPELLLLWSRNPDLVERSAPIVRLLAVGTLLNSLMMMPYALQLAYGWTSLSLYKNILAVILMVPLLLVLITWYGAVGAAIVWIILNAGYMLMEAPLMHRRILKGEMLQWYRVDVLLPVAAALVPAVLLRLFMPSDLAGWPVAAWSAASGLLSMLAIVSVLPDGWSQLLQISKALRARTSLLVNRL